MLSMFCYLVQNRGKGRDGTDIPLELTCFINKAFGLLSSQPALGSREGVTTFSPPSPPLFADG